MGSDLFSTETGEAFFDGAIPEYESIKRIGTGNAEPHEAMMLLYLLHLKTPTPKEKPVTEEQIKNTKLTEPEPIKKKGDGEAFEMGDIITLRKQQAIEFYQKYNPDMDINDIKSHINGIDFTKPIEIVKTPQGTELHQYTKVNTKGDVLKGDYYTDNPENTPSELGVSDKYNVRDPDNGWKQTDEIKTVQQEKVAIPKDAEGLKSTSASIEDTWSLKTNQYQQKEEEAKFTFQKNNFKIQILCT
ncbi:hypothetical protein B0A58_00210 [Flavobacterium branchiophilum NBRC 15030 = ATCC 35035]|uniref:Putative RNase toxin 46 of polymorphic toxin system n=1 Tax=Flavobacterium branchiophilum TaxID=55197 RepID=A0A543G6U0_9FLAO|nr:polymorphic toxin type 46 domain-containing protein [Flavobacterium branchiophilum]OXA82333.1 hypothetical protein B0A58_00210 [Flavobacterium branchiophilum NBRC 15030 = ATCC 35035]TQM41805.1 putative RNase toxin 46 of polymorphic toxin system [Flavobacterium branchiophilum]GEM56364.1 hypothetical protein FB1_25850 [Flavobacterium branchiophilum NBRC 15030 = ATCC 35035]